ncbi:hypothetical protein UlMin_015041 [Ulmus minor]
MAEQLCRFLLCFSILASTLLILSRLRNHKSNKKLPQGNMGFPWIGETWEFNKAQRKNQLFEEFIQPRVAKHGQVFKTHLMGSPTVIVNGANANKFFLSNEFKMVVSSWPSSSVQLMGKNSIMEKPGERQALVPKICTAVLFHLEQNWKGKSEISLYRSTKTMTFTIVCESLLGINVKPGKLETFERVLEGVFAVPVQFPGSKFWRARLEIEREIIEVVREKRKQMEGRMLQEGENKEEGMLLPRLIAGLIRGEINEKEVVDNVVLMVFAAHDTTSFAIAMTFKMLSQHPKCHALLLQERVDLIKDKRPGENPTFDDIKKMKYTWQVACESMRLFPPIFGSFRKAIVDIEFQGFTIPKGWKVLWTAYGTHYSREYFQDPLSFDPSRFEGSLPPYVFLPFGGGPRVCAGYQLAKLTILIYVHFVVTRYDWSLLYPDEAITMDPLPFPSHGMPIKISPKL